MQKGLLIKVLVIAAVFAALLLPLSMIGGIVGERAARQQAVVQEIATSSFGAQVLAGPVLVLPYVEDYDEEVGEGRGRWLQHQRIERTLYVLPATSRVAGTAAVDEKHRGLFKVRTFRWTATLQGEFALDGKLAFERSRADSRITWGAASIGLALADPRGLAGTPTLEWDGKPLVFERGSGLPGLPDGVHARANEIDPGVPQRLSYALGIALQGTQSLALVPVAGDNRVSLQSEWRHPGFGGQFLPQPESQQVGSQGFTAEWNVTALSSSAQQQLQQAIAGHGHGGLSGVDRLAVSFIDPIDIYSLSNRSLKYAFLFIGLTFGFLALLEVVKGLRVHPAQYGLVGLALATFFLLLLALSEHVAFGIAYLAASTACIALLGFYAAAVMRSVRRGLVFTGMLVALYGTLYVLLMSEDDALLLGAIVVFGVLAVAMIVTRHVDWYRIGVPGSAASRGA